MEDMYRLDPAATTSYSSDDILKVGNFSSGNYYCTATTSSAHGLHIPFAVAGGGSILQFHTSGSSDHMSDLIKAQIANHPRYPNLVSAYIECQKVGAPPEMVSFLEEIVRENNTTRSSCTEIGADPALDEFMESYCEVLHRYKVELSKPFDEATTFFSNIESQLINLCKGELTRALDYPSDEAAGTSEEDLSHGEVDQAPYSQDSSRAGVDPGDDQDAFKAMLMRKYSGHFSTLKKEFLKKRKKSLLPKDARKTLIDWWNAHYRWPYPTEEEKMRLSEETGLDQKQINNWFINQRKRHWKPSEDMRFTLSDGVRLNANNIN